MGYLDNSTVTVDAILTNKGRQILASGGQLNITKFALSDDEIDYSLWNPSHTLGTNYYGAVIEAMPIVEANPDETQMMRYKLVTLPRGTAKLPVIDVGYNAISLRQGASLSITPQTLNYLGATSTYEQSGYVATIGDVRTMSAFNGLGVNTPEATALNTTTTIGTNVSKTVIGTTINLTATTLNTLFGVNSTLYTTLVVIGRDSGARISIPVNTLS